MYLHWNFSSPLRIACLIASLLCFVSVPMLSQELLLIYTIIPISLVLRGNAPGLVSDLSLFSSGLCLIPLPLGPPPMAPIASLPLPPISGGAGGGANGHLSLSPAICVCLSGTDYLI